MNAYGQMRHQSGKIEKQATSWVIIFVHDKSTKSADAIQRMNYPSASHGAIINAYRKQFGNLQVMYTASPVNPKFFYPD